MNNNSGRKKKKGGVEEDAQSQQPSGMVSLPAIQNIPSYSSTATSSSWQSSHHPSHHSSSTIGGTSLLSDMTITSNLASLPVSESPYLALSAQQQELKKLLMASIKKQPAEEIDVRQAFGLKRSSTAKATSSNALIANKIPYSKAAEDAIITGAMKFSESMERNADSTVNLRAYQIPAQTLAAAPVSAGPATKAVKEAKASKEKKEKPSRAAKEAKEPPEPKAPKEKPKDREEVARLNKEKEERNAFRLKQLNHEMLVHKYHSFFLEEAGPVPMERKKTFRDNLLEEMQFVAIDFSQERRWKMATHQSIAALCVESISLITAKQRKVFEQVLQPLKDICSKISATVRNYWETYNIYQNKSDGKLLAKGFTSQEASRFFFEAVDEVLPSIIDNLRVKKLFYAMENTILTSKQMECTNRIAHINSIGYGAILFGLPHSGKSMVLAYLVKEWIVGARRSFLNSAPSLQPCVVVFSPWYVLALWQYKLQLVGVSAAIWNATMKTTLVSNVLLVCNRDAITFMETFGQYVDCKIVGVVLDTRESVVELVKCNKDRIIKGSACRPSEENNDWIPVVFEIIGASVSRRCVVVDDLESCPVDKSHLLAALVPAYFAYKHLYPPARRCLDLMERLKVQCDLDHQASLKTKEQAIIAIPMNPVQRRKYQNLLQKAEFSSLHEALALVKRVCFHEMLVPDYVLGIPDNGMPSGKPTCASFSTATLNICRQASLNISRTFDYRNTSGSCKLEHLVARFREEKLQKLQSRVIVVVSTDLEANLTHRCLLTSGIGHLASSVSTSPIIYHLSTQEVMRKFNDTSRVGYASAVAIVKDSVFNFPNICPMNVDTVYILSSSWATARNYCRCLRSNESNIYRLIAADTLEELQERKGGSFLHLQHYRITDARPILSAAFQKTFVFDSSKLLSNAPYILEFLKERSQPVVRSGMGKGKGCFLDGLNATSANVETEEVDNSNALIEWISKFYYDLEMAEKSLSGRIEQSFHFGWPLQTLESIRGVGKGSPLLHRYAALTVYRSMVQETESIHRTESPSSLAEAPQALKLPALIVSRVSQHEERLAFLHYSKVGPQSSSADDFSHQLHNLYRAGALVDPCLYISPLCGGSGKYQPMIPPRRRKFEADFELQFIVEPPAPIAKVLPKKARTSSTGGANPRRRNPNPGERSKKSVGAVVTSSNASDSVALSDSIHFDDFDLGFDHQLGLFGDELDLEHDMDLDF